MSEMLSKDKISYLVNGADLRDINNYSEIMVLKCLREVYENDPSLCTCNMCTEDVYALAMNAVPVHYIQITSENKYKHSDSYVHTSKIKEIVREAINKIKKNPNHD